METSEEAWARFLQWLQGKNNSIFRGQKNSEWELTPKLMRYSTSYTPQHEIIMLEEFKKRVISSYKFDTDFEYLVLAQHHGLPTRLLDFTENPLIACYFACEAHEEYIKEDNKEKDSNNSYSKVKHNGKVFAFMAKNPSFPFHNVHNDENPFEHGRLSLYYPSELHSRIRLQSSCFLIVPHPKAIQEYNNQLHVREPYEIKHEHKEYFLMQLNQMGINRYSVYNDIESLCYMISDDKNLKQKSGSYNSYKFPFTSWRKQQFITYFTETVKTYLTNKDSSNEKSYIDISPYTFDVIIKNSKIISITAANTNTDKKFELPLKIPLDFQENYDFMTNPMAHIASTDGNYTLQELTQDLAEQFRTQYFNQPLNHLLQL
jgi:hypothetical protein